MDFFSRSKYPPLWTLVCQSLIWDRPFSNVMQYLSLAITNIHCIFILISFQFQFVTLQEQNDIAFAVKSISKNLILKETIGFHDHPNAIQAVLKLVFIYFLAFLVLHLSNLWNYYHNKRCRPWREATSAAFAQFHLSIGFWAINAFLMDYLRVSDKGSSSSLFILTVLLIALNYILAGFFSLFSHDPFLSPNILSSFTPAYQGLTVLFKAIAAPLIFLTNSSSSAATWSFVTISFIILAIREYHLVSRFPYYKYLTMKFCVILSTIACLLIFLITLALVINSSGETRVPSQTLVFTELLLIPFAAYAALEHFKRTTFQFLSKQNSELKTPPDVVKRIFAINTFIEKTQFVLSENSHKRIYELGFWSLLQMNNFTLDDDSASFPTKAFNKIANSIIEKLLEEMVKKFKTSLRLKALQIDFGLRLNKHIEVLIFYLEEMTKISGQTQFLNRKLYHKLQENMDSFLSEKKLEMIDIRQFIQQENLAEAFTIAIKENLQGFLDFWKEYLIRPQIQVQQFFLRNKSIEKGADEIENLWSKHSETNKHFALTFYAIYSSYLQLLKAAPFRAHKLAQRYASFKQEEIYRAHEDGFDEASLTYPNVICIHTCMNKENPGKVLKVTSNLTELTGWLPHEAINNDVNLLMPQFMANDHPEVLVNHIQNLYANEKPQRMHQTVNTFILHKSGYILPCDIYLTFHPYIQETPVYVGFLKVKEVRFEKILFNVLGEIEGFTQEIGALLGLTKGEENLKSFCTNFSEVFKHTEDLTLGAESNLFLIHFRHQVAFTVHLSFRIFNKKPYYILSFHQEPSRKKLKSSRLISKPSMSLLSPQKTDINQSESYCSDDFDEVPKGYNQNNSLLPSPPILVTGRSQKSGRGRVFQFAEEDQVQAEERSPTHQKLNSRFLTTENARLNTGDSLAVEEPKVPLSSQRSLLGLGISPRNNDFQKPQLPIIKAPTSLDSTSKRFKTRLELALMMVPKNRFLGFLFWSIILFMIISIIILAIFDSQASATFSLVHSSSETISNSITRLAIFTDMHANVRGLWQGQIGIITPDRWDRLGYKKSVLYYFLKYIPFLIDNLRNANNAVRASVYKLDPEIKKQIYQGTIPVYELQDDGTIRASRRDALFDLSTELVSQATKFANSGLPFNEGNPYLLFVLNNTMNDPLVLGKKEVSILLSDNILKLNYLTSFIYFTMALMAFITVLIILFFTYIVKKFTIERNHFLEIFAILNEKALKEHIEAVKEFQNCLLIEFANSQKKRFGTTATRILSQDRRENIKRRKLNSQGINKKLIILFLSFIAFVFLLFSVWPMIYSQVHPGNKEILSKMNLMVQSNWNLFNTILSFNMLYLYVQEPDATVENEPVEKEFEIVYNKLTAVQDFIINDLLDPEAGIKTDSMLYKTAVGNLCEIFYFYDPIVTRNCPTIGGGFMTRGLVGMNGYLVSFIQKIFLSFKHSNRTVAAAWEAMNINEAITWEAFYPFIYSSYQTIDQLIRDAMMKNFHFLANRVTKITIAYIVIYIVVAVYCAFRIKKSLQQEMADSRKIIRRIPYSVASENQHLKAFLRRTTGFL